MKAPKSKRVRNHPRDRQINPRHPHVVVSVDLSGPDGNAFVILARVTKELKKAGVPPDEIQSYLTEAKAEDYEHLLKVTRSTVTFLT